MNDHAPPPRSQNMEQYSHNGERNGLPDWSSEESLMRYLHGELSRADAEQFEAHAATHAVLDPDRAQTVLAYSQLLDAVSDGIVDKIAVPDIRSRVLAITEAPLISHVVRAEEETWVDSGYPGIAFKLLFKEPDTGKLTVLARLAPGARMPHHRHVGLEECLVLEGSLWTDGVLLKGGDYIVTQDQTVHEDTWSETGAFLLLKTMMLDEILA